MKAYLYFLFTILPVACSNASDPSGVTQKKTDASLALPEKPAIPEGLDTVRDFPGQGYTRVIAYELDGTYGDRRAAAVFDNGTGREVELDQSQVQTFLGLLNNPESYGHYEMACFDPRIGLVFFDQTEQVVAYLSLCLACNNVRTEPPLDLGLVVPTNSGFTKPAYRQLKEMFNDWGIPHTGINPLME